jgi:pilus assembly protein CpaF
MGRDVVASQAVGALDQAVHLRRHGGRRYVAQIGVVGRASDGTLTVEPALDVSPDGQARRGPAWSRLADRLGPGDPFDEQRRRPGEVVPLRPRAIS